MKKRPSKILFISLCSLLFTGLFAGANEQNRFLPKSTQFQRGLNQLLSKYPEPQIFAIKVQSLQDGKVFFQRNETIAFNPASNLKILTAVASLLYLKPNYQFETALLAERTQIVNGKLEGNLTIHFSGDPELKASELSHLFANLSQQGIHQIAGNILIDNSAFDNKFYGASWMVDDLNYGYAAPISAAMVNHNFYKFDLTPGATLGAMSIIKVKNKQSYNQDIAILINQVVTSEAKAICNTQIEVQNDNSARITGCIPITAKSQNLEVAIKNPTLYLSKLLPILLAQNHVTFSGQILEGQASQKAIALTSHQSKPLTHLVRKLLKKSDNQIANALLKTLGRQYYKQAGTWENGSKAMREILTKVAHLNLDNAIFVDGDGQSRYDLISPNQLSAILEFAYHNKAIQQAFIDALPIAGIDGTLEKRMRGEKLNIRAKTGTMTGVSGLSGYITSDNQKAWSFVILSNNHVGSDERAKQLEDQICKLLASVL